MAIISDPADFTIEFYNPGDSLPDGRTAAGLCVGFLHKGSLALLLERPTAVQLEGLAADFGNAAYYQSLALNQGGVDVAGRVAHARTLRAAEGYLRAVGFPGVEVVSDPSLDCDCTLTYPAWSQHQDEDLEWGQLKSALQSRRTTLDRLVVNATDFTIEQLYEALA